MTPAGADNELVADYVTKGSESAFRALVSRHVNLVYATALRQTGDAGAAEEITQAVFVALARKAPRLAGMETLAGWLHRCAILESKARTRAELRRVRREDAAARVAILQCEGTSPLEMLVPLVDEALLHLRERDRTALLLRFWEDRNLREVGAALGVDEDAARKRVARALDRIAEFFRRRGFVVSGGAGCAALLGETASAVAPTGLAVSSASAGLATGPVVSGFNFAWFKIMALTKTQTSVLCLMVAAIPLSLQWRANARVARQQAEVKAQVAVANQNATELEQQLSRTHQALAEARTETANSETRLMALNTRRAAQPARAVYRWDDSSPYVRVPKKFLPELQVAATVNQRGTLSREIRELLQLTEPEAQQTQAALDQFLAVYQAARMQTMRPVSPTERELRGSSPEKVRVFEAPEIALNEMRQVLLSDLEMALSSERSQLLARTLRNWMPMDDNPGMNSGWAVVGFGHRLRVYQPEPGEGRIRWTMDVTAPSQGSMSAFFASDDFPELYRAHLQDWVALAQSQPSKEKTSTP